MSFHHVFALSEGKILNVLQDYASSVVQYLHLKLMICSLIFKASVLKPITKKSLLVVSCEALHDTGVLGEFRIMAKSKV